MGMPVEDLADPVAPEPIAPAPVEMPKASSAVGRASGLKKVRRGKITDLQMLIDYFFPADGNLTPRRWPTCRAASTNHARQDHAARRHRHGGL